MISLRRLQRHPFPVDAFFRHSLVLTYALPVDRLAERLPPYVSVDTFSDSIGFLAAAYVDTRALRPKGFPEFLGRDFVLAGYRIFVRYRDKRGRRLRGLCILRSETNRFFMQFSGNLFTKYNYKTSPISFREDNGRLLVSSPGKIDVEVVKNEPPEETPLPPNSPFKTWAEARRYSGPLPFTFSFEKETSEMVIIEGVRRGWNPRPVRVVKSNITTLSDLGFSDGILANAFLVSDIPYSWKAGIIERLPHENTVEETDVDCD